MPASPPLDDTRFAELARSAVVRFEAGPEGASAPAEHLGIVAVGTAGIVFSNHGGLRITAQSVGREGFERILARAPARALETHVLADHGPLEELVAVLGAGVEHAFRVRTPPEGGGALRVRLAIEGARLTVRSHELVLATGEGALLRYGGLAAWDARGTPLPARFERVAAGAAIVVDDERAQYPVTIDPVLAFEQHKIPAVGLGYDATSPAVAIDGAQAAIVSHATSEVIVLVREAGAWREQARLATPAPLAAGAQFGHALALDGDTLAVSAPGVASRQGEVHVFRRSDTSWSYESRLEAPAAMPDETFGSALAIDGSTLVVGACYRHATRGAVFVFERGASGWSSVQEIEAPASATDDNPVLGWAVALRGDVLVAGMPGSPVPSPPTLGGSAIVFERSGGTFVQTSVLVGEPGDQWFGASLATDGTRVAVASWRVANRFGECCAGANVYRRGASDWERELRVQRTPSPADWQPHLAGPVALVEGELLFAQPEDSTRDARAGAVLRWQLREGGAWEEVSPFFASDATALDRFGGALGFDGTTAIVSSRSEMGSGYLVVLRLGAACSGSSECPSGFCVDGVCCDSECGGGAGDCMACSVAAGGAEDGTCGPLAPARALETVCRAASSGCDAEETCSPASMACPPDRFALDGARCPGNGSVCDGADVCLAGECVEGAVPSCNDGDACTADACEEPSGCVHRPRCDAGHDAAPAGIDAASRFADAGAITEPSPASSAGCAVALRGEGAASLALWLVALALRVTSRRIGAERS